MLARRLVITAVLAAALFGFLYAFTLGEEDPVDPRPAAVERVTPRPGELVLRQTTIEADLAPGWTGVLAVDGREIPSDQLNCIADCGRPLCDPSQGRPVGGPVDCRPLDPQYRLFFVPGPRKEIEELAPGSHRATVTFWPLGQTRERADTYSWAFRVS
jgi:hypothetical protein